jgi:rifampicin phosphotransferase
MTVKQWSNMSDYVALLGNPEAENIKEVGGKAASLTQLIRNGFEVPAGFVVTTRAYRQLAHATSEPSFERRLGEAFDNLSVPNVAVRSSAVSEDSSEASWAGQFESYLNVDRAHLLERVQDCWQSARAGRVKAYSSMQAGATDVSVAVVVQSMVAADTAGVLFTINPVTNDAGQLIVEAVAGLGESLVSGTRTPDTYILKKQSSKVITQDNQQEQPLLSSEQLVELSSVAKRIEALYDRPMDIEWAYSQGKLYILQARAITTVS